MREIKRIIGIDPGKTTGIAIWDLEEKRLYYKEFDVYFFDDPDRTLKDIKEQILEELEKPCFVAIEDVLPAPPMGRPALKTMTMIISAILMAIAEKNAPYVLLYNKDIKKYDIDVKKIFGWEKENPHAKDAFRLIKYVLHNMARIDFFKEEDEEDEEEDEEY